MDRTGIRSHPPLPNDAILVILEHIALDTTASLSHLANLSLVSRSFHQTATPLLYRNPTLSKRNCFKFFRSIFSLDEIDRAYKEKWWEGWLGDKESTAARRLAMLRYVQNIHLADLEAVIMCGTPLGILRLHRLQAKSKKLPMPPTDDSSANRLFHSRAPTNIHLSSDLLTSLSRTELSEVDRDCFLKIINMLRGSSGILSVQQPKRRPLGVAAAIRNYLEPLCRLVEPQMLVLNDVQGADLSAALSVSQRGVAIRFRDSRDRRSIGQCSEIVAFLSRHSTLTREPLYCLVYNFSDDGSFKRPEEAERWILRVVWTPPRPFDDERGVRLKIVMEGAQSNIPVERMGDKLKKFMESV
ncbi:hypothetical protein L198_07285 [Cryptococcus wingfieldii CBS 7118]|uniref:Uncharacterized protein n=1 Tax=Cryptococcus wingfieldii CBS 7118 TaxID=1295528 RepID=A0A1E3IFT3_9TREE|nr:hypothetical protein L198_07285 [Cryptococcus wingfieldii CBS 7118]ODN86591.1 hypothetical protein L198_07285 [Cryptococcus wingfieldii CBS 7118]